MCIYVLKRSLKKIFHPSIHLKNIFEDLPFAAHSAGLAAAQGWYGKGQTFQLYVG